MMMTISNKLVYLMTSADSRKTVFGDILNEYRTADIFRRRADSLRKLDTYHLLPVSSAAITDRIVTVTYKMDAQFTLETVVTQRRELLPSQIKTIVWQLVKAFSCAEKDKVNHLRLHPGAIVITQDMRFLWLKDFSFGKEFRQVSEGKVLKYFEYQHPELSVGNRMFSFVQYHAEYDIWAMGVILYHLIYHASPFSKPGLTQFSKTILRKYQDGQHVIPFNDQKYASLNTLIAGCLRLPREDPPFPSWQSLRKYLMDEEEIYGFVDFHDVDFRQLAEQHCKVIFLLASIHVLIEDQVSLSPHIFWKMEISQNNPAPFALIVGEAVLALAVELDGRFWRVYEKHVETQLKPDGILLKQLKELRENLQLQARNRERWHVLEFQGKFTTKCINHVRQICAKVKIQLLERNRSTRYRRGESPGKRDRGDLLWNSLSTLFDFCHETLDMMNQCRNRRRLLYDYAYLSSSFDDLATKTFGFQTKHSSDYFQKNRQ